VGICVLVAWRVENEIMLLIQMLVVTNCGLSISSEAAPFISRSAFTTDKQVGRIICHMYHSKSRAVLKFCNKSLVEAGVRLVGVKGIR
jgi:hypothetical protein